MNHLPPDLIKELIVKTVQDGGVTYSFSSGGFIEKKDAWFYPRYPDLTQIVPQSDLKSSLERFTADHATLLSNNAAYLGTWRNPDTGNYHIDINTCDTNKDTAASNAHRIGKERGKNILAIFNPALDQSVEV